MGLVLVGLVASVAAVAVTLTTRDYLIRQLDERLYAFAGGPSNHPDAGHDLKNYVNGDDGDGDADPPVTPTHHEYHEGPPVRGVARDAVQEWRLQEGVRP